MPNLHNQYESTEKTELYGQLKNFLFLATVAILNGGWDCRTQFRKEPTTTKFGLIWVSGSRGEVLNVKAYDV